MITCTWFPVLLFSSLCIWPRIFIFSLSVLLFLDFQQNVQMWVVSQATSISIQPTLWSTQLARFLYSVLHTLPKYNIWIIIPFPLLFALRFPHPFSFCFPNFQLNPYFVDFIITEIFYSFVLFELLFLKRHVIWRIQIFVIQGLHLWNNSLGNECFFRCRIFVRVWNI